MQKDMTRGNPTGILIAFTLPMLLGNLFQQLYNVVDTIIVGNYVGAGALAAVGASTALVFLFLCLAIGLSMGCSVLVAQYFGACQYSAMRQAVYVSLVFIGGVGLLVSALGIIGAHWLLTLISTPDDIMADAQIYLVVYCVGGVFMFIYNALASLCRAIGDSRTPLYFLIATSAINIAGDLVFVLGFDMGVAGVAWATTIAQTLAAIGCGIYVAKRVPELHLNRADCVFDWSMLKALVVYAIPSTIQQTIVSLSLVAVQGLINTFGTVTIAGYTAASKIDNFATQPLLSLNMALTSYTAQNIGARQFERIKKGLWSSIAMTSIICVVLSLVIWRYGAALIGLFVDTQSADVVAAGVGYIRIVSVCYILNGLMFMTASVLRGAGDMRFFLWGTLINFAIRILMAYGLAGRLGFTAVAVSIPIGWAAGLLFNGLRVASGRWKNQSIIH